jgi:hypothetical protein
MRDPATYRRGAGAVCLVLAGVLSAIYIVLAAAPGWDSDAVARLQAVADAGTTATVSFLAFAAYQLPLLIGLLGVAHLLRGRTPLLANLGATFAAVGAIGYAVYGGSQLLIPAMAADQTNLELYAQLRTAAEPLTEPFAALGMVGSVLGLLLLSIALFRAKLGPRWVPVTLWAFFAVEFVGTSLSPAAAPISASLLLIALLTLAVVVQRSPVSAWISATDTPPDASHRAAQAVADGDTGLGTIASRPRTSSP